MKFLAALAPLLMTVVGRVFAALGLVAVSFVGLRELIDRFQAEITNLLSGAPLAFLQIFYLAGGGVILNILFGAMIFSVSFKQLTRISTMIGRGK